MDRVHVGEFVLPLTLPQLTEEFFVQVCKERWSETQTLEFKAVLSKGDEDARQEFRKDICALKTPTAVIWFLESAMSMAVQTQFLLLLASLQTMRCCESIQIIRGSGTRIWTAL